MIAEYVSVAGAPLPDTPWPLVLEIAGRAPQFEARRQLSAFEATSNAIAANIGGNDASRAIEKRNEKLRDQAFPSVDWQEQDFVPNAFAEGDDG